MLLCRLSVGYDWQHPVTSRIRWIKDLPCLFWSLWCLCWFELPNIQLNYAAVKCCLFPLFSFWRPQHFVRWCLDCLMASSSSRLYRWSLQHGVQRVNVTKLKTTCKRHYTTLFSGQIATKKLFSINKIFDTVQSPLTATSQQRSGFFIPTVPKTFYWNRLSTMASCFRPDRSPIHILFSY